METSDYLAAALFRKARRKLLAHFFAHPSESYYLRQLVRELGLGVGAVQRELRTLAKAEIIVAFPRGREVLYEVNQQCPIFAELQALMVKTSGVADVLREAFREMIQLIRVAFIHGSMVTGSQNKYSDIDLIVVGKMTFAAVVAALAPAQEKLGREVNASVYSPQEFRRKLAQGHHFLTVVCNEPKVFLVGGERELAKLATSRLADRAPSKSAGNHGLAGRGRSRPDRLARSGD
jgi:predicted nucleotidyltransferase